MEIRLNIFDENNKWVGQEYLTEKGKWLHRWTLKGELEKGSWRGRAKGDNELNWRYERVEEEDSIGLKANELLPHVSQRSELLAFLVWYRKQPDLHSWSVDIAVQQYEKANCG